MLKDEKHIVLSTVKKIVENKLVIGSQGNVSVRFRNTHGVEMIAITPSGVNYDELKLDDIVVLGMSGKLNDGEKKPSIELSMHLGIYKKRPDINAVIHSHALFSSVLAVARMAIPPVLDEQVYCLGSEIRIAKYARPGTKELAKNVIRALGTNNAVIMPHHGALTVGIDMTQALNNSLLLERVAQVVIYSALLKRLKRLPC